MSALLGLSALVWVANGPSPPEPSIDWVAPRATCPSPQEVRDRLVRLLGNDAAPVRAHARVDALPVGWRVELELSFSDRTDTRTLVSERCDTLANAAVILVAATADPVATARHEPPASTSRPDPAEPSVPPLEPRLRPTTPTTPTLPASTDAPSARPELAEQRNTPPPRDRGPALGVLAVLDQGSLPGPSAGLALSLGWRWPRARISLEGRTLPARPVPSNEPYARQGRVQLGTGRLDACGRTWIGRAELPLCGGVELGGTWAAGFGVQADRGASDVWVALSAGTGVVLPLMPPLALVARVEAAVPLVFSQYVHGDNVLYRARAVGVRGGIGFEFRWGQRKPGRPENLRGGES